MTPDPQFAQSDEPSALALRFDAEYETDPHAFQRRVRRRAMVCCALLPMLAMLPLLSAFLIVVLIWLKQGSLSNAIEMFALTAYAGNIATLVRLRALYRPNKFERQLQPNDAPGLFDLIDDLRQASRAPKIHEVTITTHMNAAANQRPVSTVLGIWRNELIIGLPLVLAMPEEEFRSILAHELAHFSGEHGHSQILVTRARVVANAMLWHFSDVVMIGFLPIRRLNKFYLPEFLAMAAVFDRRHEYQADSVEAGICGPVIAGNALKRLTIAHSYMAFLQREYWNEIPDPGCRPARLPYSDMAEMLQHACAWEKAGIVLQNDLEEAPGLYDSHPTLTQRLNSFGADSEMPKPIQRNAKHLLEPALEGLVSGFDDLWWAEHSDNWNKSRNRLSRLKALDQITKPQGPWSAPVPA